MPPIPTFSKHFYPKRHRLDTCGSGIKPGSRACLSAASPRQHLEPLWQKGQPCWSQSEAQVSIGDTMTWVLIQPVVAQKAALTKTAYKCVLTCY